IVSELDKINELIRLKKEQLKDFDNLAQSLFYEMFGDPVENEKGWEAKKLGEIGEFKNGLNFSKDENGHSIKFLGVSDFQNKKSIASDQLDCISLSECVQEDYLLKTGDIVFVRSNGKKELIGRSVKMYITEPTTYSGFCIRCRITDEKVDKDYIAILLKTPIIRQFMTNSGRGCNISNLNQKILNSIPTILPPLPLQRLFAQRIEQIEREKSEVQKSIQDLETLLASRMQYWFE
ncbi:MAG: restriction endonuclease subunit S, partial [Segatella copri]